jgi:hypothetical protein
MRLTPKHETWPLVSSTQVWPAAVATWRMLEEPAEHELKKLQMPEQQSAEVTQPCESGVHEPVVPPLEPLAELSQAQVTGLHFRPALMHDEQSQPEVPELPVLLVAWHWWLN